MSRRRRLLFSLAAVVLALVVSFLALLAVDVYLHGRFQKSAGFNVWGYRGPALARKQRAEYRVVVLGGSAAYGYGVNWNEAIPAVLERKLADRRAGPFTRFTVANLGYNNEGAFSFQFTLKDYLSLKYDLACLYEGYNDLIGDPRRPNTSVFRHDSPVFRLTGYMPIFPMIFNEKAAAMLYGGDIGALYRERRADPNDPRDQGKTVFRPGIATRTTAEALMLAAQAGEALERQLGRVTVEPPHVITDAASTGCKYPWQEYCQSMFNAVQFALQHNVQVLVVTQPYGLGSYRARHMEQQREMAALLQRRFGGDRRVRYVDLGDTVNLGDALLSFDRMHLTAAGTERLADGFVQPVLEMASARAGAQP